MTGWGQDGPLSETAGHDISYLARTGVLHAVGRVGDPTGALPPARPTRALKAECIHTIVF